MKFTQPPTPLSIGESGVRQMTFDGKYYYFTLYAQKNIVQTTVDFCPIGNFPTIRVYDCLCFDPKRCCFWATVQGCCTRLFQLNCGFEEVACHSLAGPVSGNITGLSYHVCHNSVWIAYPCGVVEYNMDTQEYQRLPEVSGLITSILTICPAYLFITRTGKKQMLHIYFDTGVKIKEITLPPTFTVRSILYQPCLCETPRLDFLLTQGGCYPQIAQIPITNYELGFDPCFCNNQLCEALCCAPASCHPVEDVLESIALVEAALSHILNAQGEQLQKIVEDSSSVEEMLSANEKINETITKVTHLEMLLHNKLEALGKICACENACASCSAVACNKEVEEEALEKGNEEKEEEVE